MVGSIFKNSFKNKWSSCKKLMMITWLTKNVLLHNVVLNFSDDMTILFSGRKMLYRTKKRHRYNQVFWKLRYRHYNLIHKNIVIDCVKTWQPMTIFSLPKTAHICDIFCRRIFPYFPETIAHSGSHAVCGTFLVLSSKFRIYFLQSKPKY